ncbi:MAG: DUF861 domain-containing protein [Rubrivivax sp.]|nr:MAG: DUF861 domain-containing protein [Rubrivivax sp.]
MHRFNDTVEPRSYHLPAEKLITGNPLQTLWLRYLDATGNFSTGHWHSEVGKWHVAYTEEEYCEVLEGLSVLTAADGTAHTLRAGDRFVIPRGFSGTWEVLQPTRKFFVAHEG